MKRFFGLILATSIPLALGALELDGATSFQATLSEAMSSSIETGIGLTQRFSEDALLVVGGRAQYRLPLDEADGEFSATLDEFSFTDTTATGPESIVSYALGRISLVDLAGLVSVPAADGATFVWARPTIQIGGFAATSLLLSSTQAPRLTASDLATDDLFASQRVFGGGGIFLPERWGRINAGIEYIGQIDLRQFADSGDDYLSSGYLAISATHPLGPRSFGSIAAVGSHGVYGDGSGSETSVLGGLAFAQIRGYLDAPGLPTGTLTVIAGSGDQNDGALPEATSEQTNQFLAGPYASPWRIAPVGLANVAALTLTGTLRPARWLLVEGSASLLARPSTGTAGVPGAEHGSAGLYGSEMVLTSQIKPFGDLELRAEGAIFLPFSSGIGVFPDGTERIWEIVLAVELEW